MDLIQSDVLTQFLMGDNELGEDGEEEEGSVAEREDYLKKLLVATQDSVRQANNVPVGTGYSIRTSNPQNAHKANEASASIMSELFSILSTVCSEELSKGPVTVSTPESLSKNYEKLVDCMEGLLTKVDRGLDVCNSKHPCVPMGPILTLEKENRTDKSVISLKPNRSIIEAAEGSQQHQNALLVTSSATTQPSYWKYSGVNAGRFVPTITFKPYAISPLPGIFHEAQQQVATLKMRPATLVQPQAPLPHPYEDEIKALDWEDETTAEGKNRMFQFNDPKIYQPLETTPLVWVTTATELEEMIDEIKNDVECREIAIDVEHHSQHSYRGITCLIQLSTRTKDYIIDPINIQDELVQLNEITSNPKIVKVLHGSDSDVIWLQRDFSVYLVNLFDTGQASRLMEIPGGASLANLLMFYCKVPADKRFQLADWRVRPLPEELINYARSDTHYLLYIYDKMRNDLLTKEGQSNSSSSSHEPTLTEEGKQQMRIVLERSRELSLKLHTEGPPDFTAAASNLIKKYRVPIAPRPFTILIGLLEWREQLAKIRDESAQSIVSSVLLIRIANKIPRTWTELQSLSNPLPRIIHEKAIDILDIVKKGLTATEIPMDVPSMVDEKGESKGVTKAVVEMEEEVNETDADVEHESVVDQMMEDEEFSESFSSEMMDDDAQLSSMPKVLVSVSSAIRRKQRQDDEPTPNRLARSSSSFAEPSGSSLRRSVSLPADAFEILLTENESEKLPTSMVSTPTDRREKLRSSGFAELAQNGRLFARAVSSLISRDFSRSSSPSTISLSRKRQRAEVEQQASSTEPSAADSAPAKFETICEVLVDKSGGRRKKQKGEQLLSMMSHPDLEEAEGNGETLKTMMTRTPGERAAKRRKTKKSVEGERVEEADHDTKNTAIVSSELLGTPSRQWMKRTKKQSLNQSETNVNNVEVEKSDRGANNDAVSVAESPNRKTKKSKKKTSPATSALSDSVLERVREILPASFINSSSGSALGNSGSESLFSLPTLTRPQYFGSSSVQSSKPKSAAQTKKKKKWK